MRGKVYWGEAMFGETITEKQKPLNTINKHDIYIYIYIWLSKSTFSLNQALGISQRCSSSQVLIAKKMHVGETWSSLFPPNCPEETRTVYEYHLYDYVTISIVASMSFTLGVRINLYTINVLFYPPSFWGLHSVCSKQNRFYSNVSWQRKELLMRLQSAISKTFQATKNISLLERFQEKTYPTSDPTKNLHTNLIDLIPDFWRVA